MSKKIIVHCLIKNEERFIWYAINSVLPFVDQIMVWDTGSTDSTVKIVKSIKSNKIQFKEVGDVDAETYTTIRQQMLDETSHVYDWLLLMGGDEVWLESTIKKIVNVINTESDYEAIVVRTHNLVGDIYHRLPESAGQYHLAGRVGHLSMPLVNLKAIPNLHYGQPYGSEGLYDADEIPIQSRIPNKIKYVDMPYHHGTHMMRSNKDKDVMQRPGKRKYELGSQIPKNEIPEIFFAKHPDFVPDLSKKANIYFWLISALLTPIRRLRRSF